MYYFYKQTFYEPLTPRQDEKGYYFYLPDLSLERSQERPIILTDFSQYNIINDGAMSGKITYDQEYLPIEEKIEGLQGEYIKNIKDKAKGVFNIVYSYKEKLPKSRIISSNEDGTVKAFLFETNEDLELKIRNEVNMFSYNVKFYIEKPIFIEVQAQIKRVPLDRT